MGLRQEALQAVRDYLRSNPNEIGRALRNALGLRFGVPVAALQWLSRKAEEAGKVKRLRVGTRQNGISVTADLDLMKTPVRGSAVICIEQVALSDEELSLTLRLEDVSLELTEDAETPVAALIKSGALDLSNPATLAGYLPGRSPVLVEAEGNRLVLDLMRDPKIGRNPNVRHVVGLLTSFVTVHGVETGTEHVDVVFRALPRGLLGAARAITRHVVEPVAKRFLPMLRE